MIEIEWDGFELPSGAQRTLRERMRTLAGRVDPDGRGRLQVEIQGDGAVYRVAVDGRNERGWLGVEARHEDLSRALERALSLALASWAERASGR